MTEAMDMDGRLDQLVRAGLMPTSSLPLLKRAISRMHAGMSLQGAERDVMNMFISSMMFIVLGDDTVFNKARAGAKSYATEEKEKTEYDYEGDMAMGQLKSIIANSQRMHDMLSDDTNLPEWVQSKITLAEDYISTASNYMQGEMNEEKMPFDGPYRKVGERKDKYGNTIKNAAKHLAKKAMNAQTQKNEEVEVIDELSKATMGRYIKKAATKIGTQGVTAGLKIAKDERSQKNFDTIGKRERGISTAVKKITKEEVEITEASVADVAKTAHLHVRAGKHDSIHTAIQSAVNTHFPSSVHSAVTRKKVAAQALNRIQSMNKSKMTKEEVESIDEISKKTAFSAAATSQDPTEYDDKRVDKAEKIRDHIRRKWGKPALDHADAHGSATHWGRDEPGKSVYTRGNPDKLAARAKTTYRMTNAGKANKQDLKARFRKEEVEQVDEISKATMGRYINKAKDSIDNTSYRSGIKDGTAISSSTPYKSNNPLEKKLSKRHKGIETAVKKLTKEDIDAVKQMNESYKTAFETALTEYGIKSPSELDESKRKEFFNHVDLEFKKGDN
jgi:hypothetical protein